MSFLEINGYTIPVARGGKRADKFIGEKERAFDGTLLSDVRAVKREFTFDTPPVKEMVARAIRGLVRGEGHYFDWSNWGFGSKGLNPGSTYVLSSHDNPADGRTLVNRSPFETPQSPLAFEPATTNLFAEDVRKGASHLVFTATGGAVKSDDGTHYWSPYNSNSVSVQTDAVAAVDGIYASFNPGGAGTSGNTYTFSVYVLGASGSEQVCLYIYDVTNTTALHIGPVETLFSSAWKRISVTFTLTGDSSDVRCHLRESTGGSNILFYTDGWQVEEMDHATSWADGSRAAGAPLEYDSSILPSNAELTIAAWFRIPSTAPASGSDGVLCTTWELIPDEYSALQVYRTNAGTLNAAFVNESGVGTVILSTAAPTDEAWHHVAFVARPHAESGENKLELYLDGVSADTDNSIASEDFSEALLDTLYVGTNSASGQAWDGLLADFLVLPYAAPSELVSAIYSSGVPFSSLPRLRLGGDCVASDEVIVEGDVSSESVEPVSIDGVWRNNARSLQLQLQEA